MYRLDTQLTKEYSILAVDPTSRKPWGTGCRVPSPSPFINRVKLETGVGLGLRTKIVLSMGTMQVWVIKIRNRVSTRTYWMAMSLWCPKWMVPARVPNIPASDICSELVRFTRMWWDYLTVA